MGRGNRGPFVRPWTRDGTRLIVCRQRVNRRISSLRNVCERSKAQSALCGLCTQRWYLGKSVPTRKKRLAKIMWVAILRIRNGNFKWPSSDWVFARGLEAVLARGPWIISEFSFSGSNRAIMAVCWKLNVVLIRNECWLIFNIRYACVM